MRNLFLLFLPVLFFTLVALPYVQGASANGSPSSSRQNANSQDSSLNTQRHRGHGSAERAVNQVGSGNTYMVVDSNNNRIKVIVEGKEVAYFHKGGLYVDGAITTSSIAAPAGSR